MTESQDVIAAFADGELVEPARLLAALAEASGREHLVDLLVLRGLMGGSPNVRPVLGTAPAAPARGVRYLAMAALVGIAVAGGFVAGQQRATPAPAGKAPAALAPATAPSAPAPTRVIRLENGVNWNERVGGN
jgi:hypothetical protein